MVEESGACGQWYGGDQERCDYTWEVQNNKGDVKVNNKPPMKEQLEKVASLTVLDENNRPHTFKNLYEDNENGKRRVLRDDFR